MTNTVNFDYGNKKFQDTSVAVMNDILNSDMNGSSIDDAYKAVSKYAKVTKEQFEDMFNQAEKKLDTWKKNGFFAGDSDELNEDELEMVVGGSFGSFFDFVKDGISKGLSATGNFLKEHAVAISFVVGTIALCAGLGAAGFALVGVLSTSLSAAVGGVGVVSAVGATIGTGAGVYLVGKALNN